MKEKYQPLNLENDFVSSKNCGYAFISSAARLTDASSPGNYSCNGAIGKVSAAEYGQICVAGDVIEMHLDLKHLTLKYDINNIEYGIAFENIEECEYKAAVCIEGEGYSIRLLD